jgi:hypothetical protein
VIIAPRVLEVPLMTTPSQFQVQVELEVEFVELVLLKDGITGFDM